MYTYILVDESCVHDYMQILVENTYITSIESQQGSSAVVIDNDYLCTVWYVCMLCVCEQI